MILVRDLAAGGLSRINGVQYKYDQHFPDTEDARRAGETWLRERLKDGM